MVTISLLFSLKYISDSEKLNIDTYLEKAMKNLIFPRVRLGSPTLKSKGYSKMLLSIKVFFFSFAVNVSFMVGQIIPELNWKTIYITTELCKPKPSPNME